MVGTGRCAEHTALQDIPRADTLPSYGRTLHTHPAAGIYHHTFSRTTGRPALAFYTVDSPLPCPACCSTGSDWRLRRTQTFGRELHTCGYGATTTTVVRQAAFFATGLYLLLDIRLPGRNGYTPWPTALHTTFPHRGVCTDYAPHHYRYTPARLHDTQDSALRRLRIGHYG